MDGVRGGHLKVMTPTVWALSVGGRWGSLQGSGSLELLPWAPNSGQSRSGRSTGPEHPSITDR